MKKTLILALCAAVAPAFADSAIDKFDPFSSLADGTKSESEQLVISAPQNSNEATISLVQGADASNLYAAASGKQAQVSVTFTLNITEIINAFDSATEEAPFTTTKLMTFDFDADTGLCLTADGKLAGFWLGIDGTNNASIRTGNSQYYTLFNTPEDGGNHTLVSALEDDLFYDGNGTAYLNLTVTQDASSTKHSASGFEVYTKSLQLIDDGGLASDNNTALNGIILNTNYITGAAVTPVWLSESEAKHAAAIPEPATATLSLLALAGLAARRRRK